MKEYYQKVKRCQSYIEENDLENEFHVQENTLDNDDNNKIIICHTLKGPNKAPLYMTVDEFIKYCIDN